MFDYSVLMSVYIKEKPKYLRQSIESMLNQTASPEQFVIVKDGNLTNELEDVLSEYEKSLTKLFTVVPLPENIGLGCALNEGLKYCRNDLVARMDSDDISLPQRCEKQLALFGAKPQLNIISSNIDEFAKSIDNITGTRVVPENHDDIVNFARRRNPFNHVAVMFRKSSVIRCGGYKKLKRAQDFDLFVHMVNMGCKAENINESLVLVRINETQIKRRKSWKAVLCTVQVSFMHWKRGYCSFIDLMYVIVGQIAMLVFPKGITSKLTAKFLRKGVTE